ncbi:MAG: A/G-specific adenine glycosylase [Treponema sp.]|jgi:A/G-specific adenine glycosylase|nr:A/G-specific adenine glycosylase [Treponema sp.]
MTIGEFKKTILDYYACYGRDFPWRTGVDPWGVVVSEFMLQQTQTARVVPYWEKWMKKWPLPADLALASLEDAVREWSGLGYNRRAKHLWECSKVISTKHNGRVPDTPETLLTLPGIGPYSAGAIACFAWNYPAVFIETNIRSVLLHFFFQGETGIRDEALLPLLNASLDRENPRRWYWALMDYGAELKKTTVNPNRKSAGYVRQSRFKGSLREVRGAIVRKLSKQGRQNEKVLLENVKADLEELREEDFYRALTLLRKDMMVAEEEGVYRIR